MATKAERFRYEEQRSGKKKPPATRHGRKQVAPKDAGARNLSARADRHASVVAEESLSGKPSRKSSRASDHRGKNSTVLERVARMKSASPQHRHAQR